MTFREFVRFTYGLVMGTSVQYVKPRQRFLWPTKAIPIDPNLTLMLGGSGICGIIHDGNEAILINTNQATAAEDLRAEIQKLGITKIKGIINTSMDVAFAGGNALFSNVGFIAAEDTLADSDLSGAAARASSTQKGRGGLEGDVVKAIEFSGETLHLIPVDRFGNPPARQSVPNTGADQMTSQSKKTAADFHQSSGGWSVSSELMVFLENRQILFTGGLFFNRIHPPLANLENVNLAKWACCLEEALKRYRPKIVVPAEGEVATPDDVTHFIAYLRALENPQIEFQECRRQFDWMEIPGHTSLEENFDWVRENLKTHTTL